MKRFLRQWGPTALYLAGCGALLRWYWYNLGPDTISYLSIAHHYLNGEWSEAVNLGWSPMISWLSGLLIYLGLPDLAAIRLVTVLSGVLLLFLVRKLAQDFELSSGWQAAVECTAACLTISYAMLRLGPDLLEAALLLGYFRASIRNSFGDRGSGIAAGLWGLGAFLTKGYALYFFLGHFAVATLLHSLLRPGQRRAIARQWLAGMLTFAVFTAPWFFWMSRKAGHFTTGTTGAWNFRLVGPDSPGYPQIYKLIPPVGEHGASMWDEPRPDLLPAWSPLASAAGLKHQLRLVLVNIKALLKLLLQVSLLSLFGLAGFLLWGWRGGETGRVAWPLALITVVIYPLGYLLILLQDRYLWSVFLLVLLLGAVAIQRSNWSPRTSRLVGAVYLLSFLLIPARAMVSFRNDSQWARIASDLQRQTPTASGRLAGCGGWGELAQIAWVLRMPFYGVTGTSPAEIAVRQELNPDSRGKSVPAPLTPQEMTRQLTEYKIDYFLALPSCPALPPTLAQKNPVGESQGARLYALH